MSKWSAGSLVACDTSRAETYCRLIGSDVSSSLEPPPALLSQHPSSPKPSTEYGVDNTQERRFLGDRGVDSGTYIIDVQFTKPLSPISAVKASQP